MPQYNVDPSILLEIKDIRSRIEKLEKVNVLQNATISSGGLYIQEGGYLRLRDGGGISVSDDGWIRVNHVTTGEAAVYAGWTMANGVRTGVGLLVQDDVGWDIANITQRVSGGSIAVFGQLDNYLNYFRAYGHSQALWAKADGFSIGTTDGGTLQLRTTDGGTIQVLAENNGVIFAEGRTATFKGRQGVFIDTNNNQVQIGLNASSVFIGHTTTSSPTNVRLESSGLFQRVTSSRKYKTDIKDAVIDVGSVLKMKGRTWKDKAQVEENPDTTERHIGFIAEELDEVGLKQFVEYDEEGTPDAIKYDRLTVGLLEVIKKQQQLIDDLQKRVEALEAKE